MMTMVTTVMMTVKTMIPMGTAWGLASRSWQTEGEVLLHTEMELATWSGPSSCRVIAPLGREDLAVMSSAAPITPRCCAGGRGSEIGETIGKDIRGPRAHDFSMAPTGSPEARAGD